jgi:hypothetical protein
MRTRTIEIPLCDVCPNDGIVLRVVAVASPDIEPFTIVRCQKHIQRLRIESEAEQVITGNGNGKDRAWRREQLMKLIKANPGLHPREYAELTGATGAAISAAGKRLRDMGLIRIEGSRTSSRYYPVDEKNG